MNRTMEKVLGIIGIAMDALLAIAGMIIILVAASGLNLLNIHGLIDPVSHLFHIFVHFLWIPVIGCVVSFVFGLVGVLNLGRRPKMAGGFFIAAAVISSWMLFTGIAFQSILYVIAGILCFVRKPELNDGI